GKSRATDNNPARIGTGNPDSAAVSVAPAASARAISVLPNMIGAPPLRAPKLRCAVMPPAPWHTGMPLIAPANRLARPRVVAKRPGRTRRAASPKYVHAVSAVAKHELANDK